MRIKLSARAPKWMHDLVLLSGALAAFAAFAIFLTVTFRSYIADSEIWHVTLASHLGEEWYKPWVITRPLFYGLLGLFELPAKKAVSIFMAAKLAMLVNSALIAWFVFRLTRRLVGRGTLLAELLPWIAVVFLFTNVVFLNQGHRIRSDLLASTFVLFALERILCWHGKGPRALLVMVLPLLATPKALLQCVPFFAFARGRKAVALAVALILACGALIVWVYPQSLDYLRNLYEQTRARGSFNYKSHFQYLTKTVSANLLFFSMAGLRAITFLYRWRQNLFDSEGSRFAHLRFALFCAVSALALALSPEPLPFLIASYLPVFSVFCALVFDDLAAYLHTDRPVLKALLPGFFVLAASPMAPNYYHAWRLMEQDETPAKQLEAIRILDEYLGRYPKVTYYDVVGLVPERATMRHFVGPNDPVAAAAATEATLVDPPHLVFFTNKCALLGREFQWLLGREYFSFGSDIYARWDRLDPPLRLNAKNRRRIYDFLGEVSRAAGLERAPDTFHALLAKPGRKPETMRLSWTRLSQLEEEGYILVALSPLDRPAELPDPIRSLIRYDGLL